ncbi:chromatin remodelling complex Rsc7/Swp82 subunit-domain-containing protein [Phycomyces blakesleeanus]|uniref:Chromatin remodelling complex Rsc7/Swp82 subunit-domain-containing protein n=1 Tax=Phycomyces blakesleeanus TaxID=4837 RepID=A0ABR3BAU0_PHYBL
MEIDTDEKDTKRQKEEESETDKSGEKKIDKDGRLLGGRAYKVSTFTLPNRGKQNFMFAMDPAKALGYRDSYLFFHRNPQLKRVRITEEEKAWLVQQGLLVSWFKNRDVAVVTARSVFKRFGHNIIKKGKQQKDDYFKPSDVGEDDDDESEPEDLPIARRQLITETMQSDKYSTQAPVDQASWMHHAALAVREFNAKLHARRLAKPTFFDVHTNITQLPSFTQPTLCRFEPIYDQIERNTEAQFDNMHSRRNGIGRGLLDDTYEVEDALRTLPEEMMEDALSVLLPDPEENVERDDYPMALIDGQFQSSYPIDDVRFKTTKPTIVAPSTLNDTAQSIMAQQYYINQVYQAVNNSLMFMESGTGKEAPVTHTQQRVQPTPQPPMTSLPIRKPTTPLPVVSPAPIVTLCGFITPKGQACKRVVMFPGEKCQLHAPLVAAQNKPVNKETPGTQTPAPTYAENKCADCHYLSAPVALLRKEKNTVCDVFAMVKCAKCSKRYHPVCVNLDTPRQVAAVESYPWSCPDCKVCCICKEAGDEAKLMICDGCDRGWHTTCCNPPLDKIPSDSWLCPLCADCHSCDERDGKSGDSYHHAVAPPSDRYKYPVYLATYCGTCHDNFTQDRICPVCLKTYKEDDSEEDENEMVACDSCDYWIHTSCDESLTPEQYQKLCDDEDAKYKCPLCADSVKPLVHTGTAVMALKGLSAPSGYCVGLLGGKVKTRGVVTYKKAKVGVPEINGTGIAEMPQL